MFWDFSEVADSIHSVLSAAEHDLRLEQAVYGLDSKDEKAIQEILADGMAKSFSVAREVHYPSSVGNKLAARKRCDLVLTTFGKPLKLDSKPPSLFDPPDQANPTDALWLEVKIAYQFREGGATHGGYGAQWRNAVVDDLRKMEAETLIQNAGLVLIVFTESREILNKDLELFEDVLMLKEVLAGFRQVKSVEILDRMGHRMCSVAVWPTVQCGE